MTNEFDHIIRKTSSMLAIIATDIIADLDKRFNLSQSDIREAVRTVSVEDLEQFTEDYPDLSLHNNMILVYLIILSQQMGMRALSGFKSYDC